MEDQPAPKILSHREFRDGTETTEGLDQIRSVLSVSRVKGAPTTTHCQPRYLGSLSAPPRVHGEVFTESDWTALSYAAENLHWLLERIILISLGWDLQNSSVCPAGLRLYVAYQWQKEQQRLHI
jgi:hypothetical protein